MRSFLASAATLLVLGACGDATGPPGPGENGAITELATLAHGGGRFVAVGSVAEVRDGAWVPGSDRAVAAWSDDGRSWARAPIGTVEGALYTAAYGNGVFVAMGARGETGQTGVILRSTDGRSWTEGAARPGMSWRSVAFGNGRFLAVGLANASETVIAASTDGVAWEPVATLGFGSYQVTFGGGVFVLYGEASGVAFSADGEEWTVVSIPDVTYIADLRWANGHFVGSASEDYWFGEEPARIEYATLVSPDGEHWERRPRTDRALFFGHAYGNGVYVGVRSEGISTSSDAASWGQVLATDVDRMRLDVIFAEGRFVAAGRGVIGHSTDGAAWTHVPVPD